LSLLANDGPDRADQLFAMKVFEHDGGGGFGETVGQRRGGVDDAAGAVAGVADSRADVWTETVEELIIDESNVGPQGSGLVDEGVACVDTCNHLQIVVIVEHTDKFFANQRILDPHEDPSCGGFSCGCHLLCCLRCVSYSA
jgi:hypothetical protein